MAMYEIYFSPTGGTKKVAEIIGSAWSCETERVDLMNPALQPEQYAFSAADICIVAVPSFAGRPDEEDCRELKEFSERIKHHLEENGDGEITVPGSHPYREYHGVPMKPKADKNCIKCGKCAAECPVQAIPKDNPSSLDKERCISCMHCIAICPEQARHNDKVVLFAAEQKMKKACSGRKANTLFL